MKALQNASLSEYTAFDVGGPAEKLVISDRAEDVFNLASEGQLWVLGYGTNCVVSDKGLPGTVLMLREGPEPELSEDNTLVIDAATSWDRAAQYACDHGLWGIELMSGIPGNAGAALRGNIAAYGQAVADTFVWAEAFNPETRQTEKLDKSKLTLAYRASNLQTDFKHLIITKLALQLSEQPTTDLVYASALKVADELGLAPDSLQNRRKIILETRARAGSIYDEHDSSRERTAGSFFKNPVVDEELARHLAGFDESGKSIEELLQQNRIHGGNEFRVSASHVMLAAGFQRGQAWGAVRLHPKHVLKIENTGGATASQIYDVAHEIVATVKDRLGIDLEPEVQFLGEF